MRIKSMRQSNLRSIHRSRAHTTHAVASRGASEFHATGKPDADWTAAMRRRHGPHGRPGPVVSPRPWRVSDSFRFSAATSRRAGRWAAALRLQKLVPTPNSEDSIRAPGRLVGKSDARPAGS